MWVLCIPCLYSMNARDRLQQTCETWLGTKLVPQHMDNADPAADYSNKPGLSALTPDPSIHPRRSLVINIMSALLVLVLDVRCADQLLFTFDSTNNSYKKKLLGLHAKYFRVSMLLTRIFSEMQEISLRKTKLVMKITNCFVLLCPHSAKHM